MRVTSGAIVSILSIVTILLMALPAASMAAKVKVPLLVKTWKAALTDHSFVEAVTIIGLFVGLVRYEERLSRGGVLSMVIGIGSELIILLIVNRI